MSLQSEQVAHAMLIGGEQTALHSHAVVRVQGVCLFEKDVSVELVTGHTMFVIPVAMNGMKLVAAIAAVGDQKGVTGITEVRLTKRREGSNYYMFTTNLQIGDVWWANNCVIDPTQEDIQTGDTIRVDVVAVHTTAPKGLTVTANFE